LLKRGEDDRYKVERPNSERANKLFETRKEAISWAKEHNDGAIHVERVRHTKNGAPYKWRKA